VRGGKEKKKRKQVASSQTLKQAFKTMGGGNSRVKGISSRDSSLREDMLGEVGKKAKEASWKTRSIVFFWTA